MSFARQDDDTEDDAGEDDEDDYSSGKEGGRPKRRRATRGAARKKGDADAKSTSTALAMLASAAGTKPGVPGVINPAAAAMQQSIEGMWALNGAAGGMTTTGSQLDLSKLTTAEQQQLLAAGEYAVGAAQADACPGGVEAAQPPNRSAGACQRSSLASLACAAASLACLLASLLLCLCPLTASFLHARPVPTLPGSQRPHLHAAVAPNPRAFPSTRPSKHCLPALRLTSPPFPAPPRRPPTARHHG